MKLHLYIALALFVFAGQACKTKQAAQETVIPMGGQQVATSPQEEKITEEPPAPTPAPKPVPATPAKPETEVRSEQFKVEEGDSNNLQEYHVVVGSFKSKTNAQNLKNQLVSENQPALIVVNQQGMFRVIISSFNDLNQAKAKRNALKSRFHGAWLLIQKK